jgi:processive 1,2-diacylglycerol beta-glucosyltransferase
MVLVKPLPGQEERNTRYLVSKRAAIRARGESNLAQAVLEVLTSEPRRTQLRDSMRVLRRPQAAQAVAERILALLEQRDVRRAAVAR